MRRANFALPLAYRCLRSLYMEQSGDRRQKYKKVGFPAQNLSKVLVTYFEHDIFCEAPFIAPEDPPPT
jgi:hypothetical protein